MKNYAKLTERQLIGLTIFALAGAMLGLRVLVSAAQEPERFWLDDGYRQMVAYPIVTTREGRAPFRDRGRLRRFDPIEKICKHGAHELADTTLPSEVWLAVLLRAPRRTGADRDAIYIPTRPALPSSQVYL